MCGWLEQIFRLASRVNRAGNLRKQERSYSEADESRNRCLQTTNASERRESPRLKVYERVSVSGPPDYSYWSASSVIDCSEGGLGIYSARPFQPGELIIVSWNAGHFIGVVRDCSPAGEVWRLGVAFEPVDSTRILLAELRLTAVALQP